MTDLIIAIDNTGQKHVTTEGNGSNYCRTNKINLDWSAEDSQDALVLLGGVFFKCLECEVSGVITNSLFTQDIKRKAGLEIYAPLGVEFQTCEQHEGVEDIV